MPSNEHMYQSGRIQRLAQRECPDLIVVFDETDPNRIRFRLEDSAHQKRSGHSKGSAPDEMKAKGDEQLTKFIRFMAAQVAQQA
jgi:hypothetical protein